jgi:aldehyde reductase
MTIPKIGLGTWKAREPAELREAIRYAVEDAGYRHIDCAANYMNEEDIGAALADLFKRGVVKRQDLWITTKLWNSKHRPDLVEVGCRESLKKLQLDYLDLYLIHHPASFIVTPDFEYFPRDDKGQLIFDRVPLIDTWKEMEKLVGLGLVKHIGVSNFTINQLERFRFSPEVKIQPFANQVEFHLYLQQEPMRMYLKFRGILMEGYSPLGSGDFRKEDQPILLDDPELKAVAAELKQPVGSVALKFLLQLDSGIAILPKSVTPARIKSNINLDGFTLSPAQFERLKKRDRAFRYIDVRRLWGIDVQGDGW